MKAAATKQDVVDLLNDCFKRDPQAINALIANRVLCNGALADHPTVQVRMETHEGGYTYRVGLLGMLNGIFGVDDDGQGAIVMYIDDAGKLIGFGVMEDAA